MLLEFLKVLTSQYNFYVVSMGFIFFILGYSILIFSDQSLLFEPRSEKNGLRGFRPGPTQTGLCSHKRKLEA